MGDSSSVNQSSSDCGPSQVNSMDLVINAYKKDIDRTLLRENLKLSVDERFQKFQNFMAFLAQIKTAGEKSRALKSE